MCSVRQQNSKSFVKWMESGLKRRATLPVVLRFVVRSVTWFIYLLPLAPHQLKCIFAPGICKEPVVRVTLIIKMSKGGGLGPTLLASFQW